jgi:uncharacterized protein YeaO (DUF488 family)
MIHTSYYQNKRLIAAQKAGTLAVVQTSNGPPRWGAKVDWNIEALFPPLALVHAAHAGAISQAAFETLYTKHLDDQAADIIDALRRLESELAPVELVLACFEALKKPGQFCHRRMFAAWWKSKTGETIPEL